MKLNRHTLNLATKQQAQVGMAGSYYYRDILGYHVIGLAKAQWRTTQQNDVLRPRPLNFNLADSPQSVEEGLLQISRGIPTNAKRLIRLAKMEIIGKILQAVERITDKPDYQSVYLQTSETTVRQWKKDLQTSIKAI